VASTVVNQQNAALGSMETDQLLDLFNVGSSEGVPTLPDESELQKNITEDDAVDAMGQQRVKGKKDMLDDMVALWDERQYEEEYDLDAFLRNMKA
jgi:TATA-binding protein-associated factor